MVIWTRAVLALAGLMGLAGVLLAAAGTHLGGGDKVHLAASFLSMHAGVVLSLAIAALARVGHRGLWLSGATVLALGTLVFAADLAVAGLLNDHPIPVAAPIGGVLMVLGWVVVLSAAFVPLPSSRLTQDHPPRRRSETSR